MFFMSKNFLRGSLILLAIFLIFGCQSSKSSLVINPEPKSVFDQSILDEANGIISKKMISKRLLNGQHYYVPRRIGNVSMRTVESKGDLAKTLSYFERTSGYFEGYRPFRVITGKEKFGNVVVIGILYHINNHGRPATAVVLPEEAGVIFYCSIGTESNHTKLPAAITALASKAKELAKK